VGVELLSVNHRRRSARGVVASALVLLLAGCGGGNGDNGARGAAAGESKVVGTVPGCVPPQTKPVTDEASRLPQGLTLPEGALIAEEKDDKAGHTLVVQTPSTVSAMQKRYRAELKAAGYTIQKEDDEGHEAELFFMLKDGRKAVVQQVKPKCPTGVVRTIFTAEPA
jgi:hypothetical protein